MAEGATDMYIISLGGSLLVPDEINEEFVSDIVSIIKERVVHGDKFAIVVGGGAVSRYYQKIAKKVTPAITDECLDWIGIDVTRMNARFLACALQEVADVKLVFSEKEFEVVENGSYDVLVSSGWAPGNSTDAISVKIAEKTEAKEVVNLSNIDAVYDRDPKKHKNATAFTSLSWNQYRMMFPTAWTPGLNSPFDPVASSTAQNLRLKVFVMNGDTKNFSGYIHGKGFQGTVIGQTQ